MRRSDRFRLRLSLAATLIAGLTVLTVSPALPAGPATAAPAGPAAQLLSAGVDDFAFDSLHADYTLGRDDEGHSTLVTTETFVARFPEADQNRGMRRLIPTHYRGEPTNPGNVSVTDGNGTERDFDTDTEDNDDGDEFLIVTIADDDFVHGEQTYVISYTQTNVAHFPDDATEEEFYWEVNGTGWAQPFGTVSAAVRLEADLVPALTGQTACYQGGSASGASCDVLESTASGDGWLITAVANDLDPHEGLALAVGFEEGTFVPRDDSFTANVFPSLALLAALAALGTAVTGVILRTGRWRNRPGRPTIIAEYLPPAGVNLLQAGGVLGAKAAGKALTAQFLQFAVNGNVRVLEGEGTKHYLLELRSRDGLDSTETAVLDALFPVEQSVGAIRDLKKTDAKLGTALAAATTAARARLLTDGLREKKGAPVSGWLLGVGIVTGVVAVIASMVAFATEVAGAWPALFLIVGLLAAILTITVTVDVRPLSTLGAELRDYLKGVSLYISLAEADRLRVLQSPTGALRTPARPDPARPDPARPDPARGGVATEPVQVLKLYERLLPFAVLTGQEKDWSAVLGDYYAGAHQQPDWYVGTAPFSAAYFATGVSAFAASASTGVASSSSGSGSSGGGSVGGGGGGGGGGGV